MKMIPSIVKTTVLPTKIEQQFAVEVLVSDAPEDSTDATYEFCLRASVEVSARAVLPEIQLAVLDRAIDVLTALRPALVAEAVAGGRNPENRLLR